MRHSALGGKEDKRKRVLSFVAGVCWMPLVIIVSILPDSLIFAGHHLAWIIFGLPLFFIGSNIKTPLFRKGIFLSLSVVATSLFFSLFFVDNVVEKLSLYLGLSAIAAMIFWTCSFLDIIRRTLYRDQYVHKRDVIVILAYYCGSILAFTFLFHGLQLENEKFLEIANPTVMILDILYFNVVTFTTLGYGDITPVTTMAKLLVALENFLAYTFVGIGFGLIVNGITKTQSEIDAEEKKEEES